MWVWVGVGRVRKGDGIGRGKGDITGFGRYIVVGEMVCGRHIVVLIINDGLMGVERLVYENKYIATVHTSIPVYIQPKAPFTNTT